MNINIVWDNHYFIASGINVISNGVVLVIKLVDWQISFAPEVVFPNGQILLVLSSLAGVNKILRSQLPPLQFKPLDGLLPVGAYTYCPGTHLSNAPSLLRLPPFSQQRHAPHDGVSTFFQ
jgi:hypothetical protein